MLWIHYWAFLLPVITTAVWLVDIIGLLVLWSRDGFPQYVESDASFVFISDVGAVHNTWFIIFSVLTGVFFIATMATERYLRSTRRIPGSIKKRQTIYDICCVIFAVLGALFLGLLSGFNDQDYSSIHWSCALLFIVCTGLAVLFQILELFSLAHHQPNSIRHLKWAAVFKATLLIAAFVVLVVFVGLYAECRGDAPTFATNTHCDHVVSGAAACEWICGFLLTFFWASMTVDLWPRNYEGKQEEMAVKEAKKHGEDPEAARQRVRGSYDADAAGHGYGNVDPYGTVGSQQPMHQAAPQHDPYGTVNTQPSTMAPSLAQQPLSERPY